MKPLTVILAFALALLLPGIGRAQEKGQSKPAESVQKTDGEKQQTQAKQPDNTLQNNKLQGFIDQNGDGIDDRTVKTDGQDQNGVRKRVRARQQDHFIDADGDGINDNRCNGLGFGTKNKGQHRRGGMN